MEIIREDKSVIDKLETMEYRYNLSDSDKQAINSIITFYKGEQYLKEEYKKQIDEYKAELSNLREIEKLHQEENGKLQVELNNQFDIIKLMADDLDGESPCFCDMCNYDFNKCKTEGCLDVILKYYEQKLQGSTNV